MTSDKFQLSGVAPSGGTLGVSLQSCMLHDVTRISCMCLRRAPGPSAITSGSKWQRTPKLHQCGNRGRRSWSLSAVALTVSRRPLELVRPPLPSQQEASLRPPVRQMGRERHSHPKAPGYRPLPNGRLRSCQASRHTGLHVFLSLEVLLGRVEAEVLPGNRSQRSS